MISYTQWFRTASLPWDHPESMYHQRYHRSINRITAWFISAMVCAIFAEVGRAWLYGLIPLAAAAAATVAFFTVVILWRLFSPIATAVFKYFGGHL